MTNSPIIGILTVGLAYQLEKAYGNTYKTYIAASYVKYLESAGARVVPIWIGKDIGYYRDILRHINGLLLPGGAIFFEEPNGYAEAGRIIYKLAKEMFSRGDYFPIWGTCLGFELLLYLGTKDQIDPRQDCERMNESLPLKFKADYRDSRMFKNIPQDIVQILSKEKVTYNYHRYCITERDLEEFNLDNEWRVMSLNSDKRGLEFISTVEHKTYPFYGVQFHPEKNAFEFAYPYVSHTSNSIKAAQYFATFFVNECRKNHHRFESEREELRHLIYNFPVTFTQEKRTKFLQSYLFLDDVDYAPIM